MARRPDQDPGQPPRTADELLTDLMSTGSLLDRHQEQAEAIETDQANIGVRRSELEEKRTEAEQALVDDFNAKNGKLGEEAAELADEERKLVQRRGRAQGKVTKLAKELRERAVEPDAERSTVLTYAAFAATKPNFTAEAVRKLTGLDEYVRAEAGEPFVLIQHTNLAFGRIEDDTEGLAIEMDEDAHRTDAISLPTASTNLAKHGRRKPYFGWVSHAFDHPRDLDDTWDSVLRRGAEEEEVINPGASWSTMSHFNLAEDNLSIFSPVETRVAAADEDFDINPKSHFSPDEGEGFWRHENVLFTGEAATAFFHKVIDARITEIEDELDTATATTELGRLTSVMARLGMTIDLSEVRAHERLIGI